MREIVRIERHAPAELRRQRIHAATTCVLASDAPIEQRIAPPQHRLGEGAVYRAGHQRKSPGRRRHRCHFGAHQPVATGSFMRARSYKRAVGG
jgi:hypothetical protein